MTAKIHQAKANNVILRVQMAIFERKDGRLQGLAG
jgi:hypothetical protein